MKSYKLKCCSISTISTNSYSISRHKWQIFGMNNEEDDYDDEASSTNTAREEDTVEAYSSIDDSNEDDDDEQPIKKRQLSLAELEDYEEARQAALEWEELQGTSSSQSMLTSTTTAMAEWMILTDGMYLATMTTYRQQHTEQVFQE